MKLHEVLQSYIKELEKVLQADAQLIKFDVALLDVTWCSKRFEISFDTSNIQIIANSCRHVTICIFLEKGPFIWNALFVFYSSFFWSINSHALKVLFRFLSRTYHTRTENYKKILDQKRFFFNKLIV